MNQISNERYAELLAIEQKMKKIENREQIIEKHQDEAKERDLEEGWIKLNYDKDKWYTDEFKFIKNKIKKTGKRYKKLVAENVDSLERGAFSAFYRLVFMEHIFNDDELDMLDKALSKLNTKKQKVVLKLTFNDDEVSYFTYNKYNKYKIFDILKTRYWENKDDVIYTSGGLDHIAIEGLDSIIVNVVKRGKKAFNKEAKFFKYINTTDIDLTRYQIIKESDDIDIVKEHCLIHTLQLYGVSEDILNNIKLSITNISDIEDGKTVLFYFAKKNLKEVSEKIQKTIRLHELQKDNKKKIYNFGDFNESIDICMYQDHYFIYEKTKYTEYSIKNYKDVKHIDDFYNVTNYENGNYKKRRSIEKIDSFRLIQLLFDNGHFTQDSIILSKIDDFQCIKNNVLSIPLANILNEQIESKYEMKEVCKYDIFYADTETCTTEGDHKCILAGIMNANDKTVQIYKDKPIKNMLEYIFNNSPNNNPIVYFHNLKYDMFVYKNHVNHIDICEKENNIYSNTILYRKLKIKMKDSYKIVPEKLAKFNKMFQLGDDMDKKEAIGFTYYNPKNMDVNKCLISEYQKHIITKDRKQFIKNLEQNKQEFEYDGTSFNPIKYYMYYLKYDVLVLKEGLSKMESIIKNICDLNIHDFLTISSLTNNYMKKNGAFEGLFEVSGNLREYLSKCIYGGRVEANQKYKKQVIKDKIVDYDAVSLYPSAIVRLCEELGFPMGRAQRIKVLNKKILDKYSYYFVTIKVKSIGKSQQIPFYRKTGENNECLYTNKASDDILVVDKCTLEDLIRFHKIEYEILDGVYYDQGFNKKMGEIIKELFKQRLHYKKEGNEAMQQILKLMLNSSYGKTIMKKSTVKKTIMNNDKVLDNIINHYNNIISLKPLNKFQTLITSNKYDDSYNLAPVGSMILSYSKRIMNEVMNIANDNDITIYYQDTDSMHMKYDDVSKLEKLYEETYNKVLQGKNMGQFHSDFEVNSDLNPKKDSPVYSVMSVFLGKKCYMDKLETLDVNNNIIHDYHIRMKGITEAGLKHSLHLYDTNENLFTYLANDGTVDFLLNPPDKVLFEFKNTGVQTRGKFYRSVTFKTKFKL
jgi:hypothetical protein